MTINGNYASPISVNGYSCNNCTDVEIAKKHIDPAHPKDGPFGVDAAERSKDAAKAVIFGGRLASIIDDGRPAVAGAEAVGKGRIDILI